MAKKVVVETKATVLDAYQAVIDEARAEFEAEKAEQAAAWKKELARIKEEDQYQFEKSKRDREDALKIELAKRVSDVTAREDAVDLREEAIGDAEKTIADLQAKVDGIPAIAAKSESVGFNKGQADAKKDFDSEVRLIKAENDADRKILQNSLLAVQAVVANQEQTIETLKNELAAANARVEAIATNAVTAAGQSKVTVHTAQNK